jgi:hypothetical protein
MMPETSAWTTVISLAQRNWVVDFSLANHGLTDKTKRAFGIWAKSHYWQGRIADVSLHAHAIAPVDPALKGEALAKMRRAVGKLAEVCGRAETEYTEGFPCQTGNFLPDGRIDLVSNTWANRHWNSGRTDLFPENTILEDAASFASRDADRILETMLDLSRDHHAEIRLDPWAGPSVVHQMKGTWQVNARLSRFEFGGEKLCFKPLRFRSEMLFEDVAADLLQVAEVGIERALRVAAPEMPPGFRTLAQYRREEEARQAARSPDPDEPSA